MIKINPTMLTRLTSMGLASQRKKRPYQYIIDMDKVGKVYAAMDSAQKRHNGMPAAGYHLDTATVSIDADDSTLSCYQLYHTMRDRQTLEEILEDITGAYAPEITEYAVEYSVSTQSGVVDMGDGTVDKLPMTQREEYDCLAWMLEGDARRKVEAIVQGLDGAEYKAQFAYMDGEPVGEITMSGAELAQKRIRRKTKNDHLSGFLPAGNRCERI